LAKKTSRKELREPDDFISFTTKAIEWASEQKFALIIGSVALALVILGSYGFRWYQVSKDKAASADFFEAKEILKAPVNPAIGDSEGVPLEKTFASNKEKFEDALEKMERVYKAHSASHAALLATYFIGELHRKMGNYEKAAQYLKEYLNEEGEEAELAAFAWEGIAATLESQGKLSEAREQYRRLTKPPYHMQPDRGFYHLARLEQIEGNKEEAAKKFKEILEKYPETIFRQEIQARLGRLPRVAEDAEDADATTEEEAGEAGKAAEEKKATEEKKVTVEKKVTEEKKAATGEKTAEGEKAAAREKATEEEKAAAEKKATSEQEPAENTRTESGTVKEKEEN